MAAMLVSLNTPILRRRLWFIGWVCALAFPSTALISRYIEGWAVPIYLLFCFGGMGMAERYRPNLMANRLPHFYLATFVILALALWAIYPVVNRGVNGGSDRDDALNIGARALWNGNYPYFERTQLDNPLSPLPGSFILAAPFVLIFGSSAYQALLWFGLLVGVAWRLSADLPLTLWWSWAFLLFSPSFLYAFLSGSDLFVNGCCVLVCAFFLWQAIEARRPIWVIALLAVLLGIAFASRLNILLTAPIFALALLKRWGIGRVALPLLLTPLTLTLLTVPFYLHAPDQFTPIHTTSELAVLNHLWQPAQPTIIFLTAALCLFLSWRAPQTFLGWICASALILFFPVVMGELLVLGAGHLSFFFTDFATIALPFGALGCWLNYRNTSRQ